MDIYWSMEIAYLADHPEFVPTLAGWFHQQWSYLYPERSLEDVATVLRERTGKDRLPLALVVLENKQLLGTVSLKIHDMDTRLQWSPWLAALFVKRECRRAGLGSLLVRPSKTRPRAGGAPSLSLHSRVRGFLCGPRMASPGKNRIPRLPRHGHGKRTWAP